MMLMGAKCCPDDRAKAAIEAVNADFGRDYAQIMGTNGTKHYVISQDQAFRAMRTSLGHLGMEVTTSDPGSGYLRASAPAPTPLSLDEWRELSAADLPRFRRHIVEHCGLPGYLATFDHTLVDVVIDVTTIEASQGGVDVDVTMAMQWRESPGSGIPERTFPPPSTLEFGVKKFWTSFETQLNEI